MLQSEVRRQLLVLGLFPLSEHIAWSSTFPYIYSMVKWLESPSEKSDSTALYASLLVSCFTFGEFLMATQWARISDSIGRKPTLLMGSLGAICSAAAFGLSSSLPMAFAARFFAGAVNPNWGVLKTYVGELTSKEMQGKIWQWPSCISLMKSWIVPNTLELAKGFSSLSFMAGLGFICGPIVGGYLAEPTKTLPSLFHSDSIWDEFPYLLPNLVVMACLLISSVLGFFFLREVCSHPKDHGNSVRRMLSSIWTRAERNRASDDRAEYLALSSANLEECDQEQTFQSPKPIPMFVFRDAFTKQIVLQILSMALESFKDVATLSLVPVFLGSPQPSGGEAGQRNLGGGFGLDTENTSTVLLTQAIASILCQILVVPQLIQRRGALWSYRLALVGYVITYVLMPMSLLFQGVGGLLTCTIILWVQALWYGIASTATSMMITNNCPSPIYLATINGVAASCGCLAKTAGPALIGALYDKGVENGNILVPFWTLCGVALLTLALTVFLQEEAKL